MMSQQDSNEEPPIESTRDTDELLIEPSVEAEPSEPRRTSESNVIEVPVLLALVRVALYFQRQFNWAGIDTETWERPATETLIDDD